MSGATHVLETPLAKVRDQIARACAEAGRDPTSVMLVAISKTFDADTIEPVIAAGQRVFGENRVQEAKAKWPALKQRHGGIELHLVGSLQSNKAKEAVALFDAIHSVDRPSLAEALAKEIARQGRTPTLFVEVNTGAEPQKAGVLPEETDAFLKACRERYASRRRRPVGPRHVHEDRAAPARHPGAGVVVDLDDEIVEVVLSPEAVAAVAGSASEGAVVPAVGGIFAPCEVGGDAARRQQGRRVPMAIGPPPQADRPKSPARGRAVALELVGADAPLAEHDRQRERPGEQDAPGRAARPRPHADQRKNAAAHGTNLRIRTHEPSVEVANRLALLPPNALFRASAVPG